MPPGTAFLKRNIFSMLPPAGRDVCAGEEYGYAGVVGSCAVKYHEPVGALTPFDIKKRTATRSLGDVGERAKISPLIGSMTPSDKILTERSGSFDFDSDAAT